MQKQFLILIILFFSALTIAQKPKQPNASEIYENIQKLNFLGSVLYVAAHPDDENTHLISYFENSVHARTAYVSLTRGDGGQNLIGSELREALGVIRTEELLAARKIDGGEQFFSRANDFGFSKNPTETFQIWNKNQVLNDLVYIIRQFQPDIIINRFDHRSPGATHGHHTASAILSVEAFDKVNDATQFPKQLNRVSIWQPQRLFFNTSWWFYGSKEKFKKADKTNFFPLEIGKYYPELGLSNNEIASVSRSQHKSQGFGNTATRGNATEYLEVLKGDRPKNDIFEGIDTTWNRVNGGTMIGEILSKIQQNYDFKNPAASIPNLLKAYNAIQNLENTHWKKIKTEEITQIISDCAGLYLEVAATSPTATPEEKVSFSLEAVNRSEIPMQLNAVTIHQKEISFDKNLSYNEDFQSTASFTIPAQQKPTSPYWLKKQGTLGMYKVENSDHIGLPETPISFVAEFNLTIDGQKIIVKKPLIYKTSDPVKGEVYQPFAVVPKAVVEIAEKVIIFSNKNSQKVAVKVKSFSENWKGNLSLNAPSGWKISPKNQSVQFAQKGEEKTFWFQVTPPSQTNEAELIPNLKIGHQTFDKALVEIDYDHIPKQNILLPSKGKIVRIDLEKKGENIGYIAGAGDATVENLNQIGYNVVSLNPKTITSESLQGLDAIVLGIRAFNTVNELKFKNKVLFDYVKNGGTLVVQYNTNRGLVTDDIAPFPLEISRKRVTDENAEVKFIDPKHTVLNTPNKITAQDFTGWTQERGLYFPNKWDKAFSPILSMHDKGEPALKSSLLVAQYGKGYYVYTGLSLFRELPAGVPGAYRLMANLLSLGK